MCTVASAPGAPRAASVRVWDGGHERGARRRMALMLAILSFEVVFDYGDHGAAPHSMVGHGGRGVVPGV
jgi:hypothetical protein